MLAFRQPSVTSIRRDAWVEIDLNAIESNLQIIRSWLEPSTKLMAVVKSDAYGHGAAMIAELCVASGCQWIGVASVDEGCQLRAAGIASPILLLSPCPVWAVESALDGPLTLSISSIHQLQDLQAFCLRTGRKALVHLKIDTGMHRLGLKPEEIEAVIPLLVNSPVCLTGVFSHLAKAEEQEFTFKQAALFSAALKKLQDSGLEPGIVHLASGDAASRYPDVQYDMVRIGLALYGLEPCSVSKTLFPALSVRARINHIQELAAGETLGYNLTWRAARPSRIASVPVGYADGVDRGLSNRMQGLLMGRLIPQAGLISMDQMLFDITDVPEAQDGDVITLIGRDFYEDGRCEALHLAEWAQALDTITYELACRLKVRMPRIYTRQLENDALAASQSRSGL